MQKTFLIGNIIKYFVPIEQGQPLINYEFITFCTPWIDYKHNNNAINNKFKKLITTNILRSNNSIIICLMAKLLGAQKLIYHSCQCHKFFFVLITLHTLRYEINGVVSISLYDRRVSNVHAFHVADQSLIIEYCLCVIDFWIQD